MNPTIVHHNGVEVTPAQLDLIVRLRTAREAKRPVAVSGYVNSDGDVKNLVFAWSSWEEQLADIRVARKTLLDHDLNALLDGISSKLGITREVVAQARIAVLTDWDATLANAANPVSGSVAQRGPVYLCVEAPWAFVIPGKGDKVYIRQIVLTSSEVVSRGRVPNSRPLTVAKDVLTKQFLPREHPYQLGLVVGTAIKA
jgi:hypothetical protein